MICQPCTDQDHANCDDNTRQAHFVRWLRDTFGGLGKPVVGLEENKVIHANRPYPSCPCQHKVLKKIVVWSCCGLPHPGPHLELCVHYLA